ncbi:MAG TPA: T9SS type A sorting domain-containing protein, partial [Nitrosomonas sp.]|nr:T9SS type A sorting domain-containing protein [Nitrosomonas sp.]
TWIKAGFVQGSGTSNNIHEYFYEDHGLVPGRYEYRIRQIDRDGEIHNDGDIEVDIPASAYVLQPNYPNPFNPSTMISFTLPEKSFVTLKIYDVVGRQVTVLVSENLQPGTYLREWNASGYPSGTYFYRLDAGTFTATRRLQLVK